MSTKTTASSRPYAGLAPRGPWSTPPWTLAERLQRIEIMGQRMSAYIQFMGQVGTMNGTSDEAKGRALKAFHETMIAMESELGQIQENLRLE